MEQRLMNEYEKAGVVMKSFELEDAGLTEEALALRKTIPITPWLAKLIKKQQGAEFLIKHGYNLSEAEAEYGQGWLDSENL